MGTLGGSLVFEQPRQLGDTRRNSTHMANTDTALL
jgi:hypothetical protein